MLDCEVKAREPAWLQNPFGFGFLQQLDDDLQVEHKCIVMAIEQSIHNHRNLPESFLRQYRIMCAAKQWMQMTIEQVQDKQAPDDTRQAMAEIRKDAAATEKEHFDNLAARSRAHQAEMAKGAGMTMPGSVESVVKPRYRCKQCGRTSDVVPLAAACPFCVRKYTRTEYGCGCVYAPDGLPIHQCIGHWKESQ